GGVDALVGVNLIKIISCAGRRGAGDEIIVDDVVRKKTAGVAAGVTGLVIIDDIVDVNRVGLGQRLPVVGIGPDVPDPTRAGAFMMRAELLVDGIGDDGILHGKVGGVDGVLVVPRTEGHRDVIKNHVGGRAGAAGGAEVDGAFTLIAAVAAIVNVALTETDVAADDVVLPVKRHFRTHDADTTPGGGLSGNGQAAAGGHRRLKIDVTAHIKNDDAVALADGVAERAGATVGERGDVIHRAVAAAGGVGAEPECAGKSRRLRLAGRAKAQADCAKEYNKITRLFHNLPGILDIHRYSI